MGQNDNEIERTPEEIEAMRLGKFGTINKAVHDAQPMCAEFHSAAGAFTEMTNVVQKFFQEMRDASSDKRIACVQLIDCAHSILGGAFLELVIALKEKPLDGLPTEDSDLVNYLFNGTLDELCRNIREMSNGGIVIVAPETEPLNRGMVN